MVAPCSGRFAVLTSGPRCVVEDGGKYRVPPLQSFLLAEACLSVRATALARIASGILVADIGFQCVYPFRGRGTCHWQPALAHGSDVSRNGRRQGWHAHAPEDQQLVLRLAPVERIVERDRDQREITRDGDARK